MLYFPTMHFMKCPSASTWRVNFHLYLYTSILVFISSFGQFSSNEIKSHSELLRSPISAFTNRVQTDTEHANNNSQWSDFNYIYITSAGLLIVLVVLVVGCVRCRNPESDKNEPLDDNSVQVVQLSNEMISKEPEPEKEQQQQDFTVQEINNKEVHEQVQQSHLNETFSGTVLQRQRSHLEIMVESMSEKYPKNLSK